MRLVRVWRKPAAAGLVVAAALLVAVLSPVSASATATVASKTKSDDAHVVPAVGNTKATLLAPQAKHPAPDKHAKPLRSMHPDALREAKRKADAEAAQAATTPAPSAPAASPSAALFNGLDQPGLSASDEGNGATPPDTTGAIGPSQYVEMVNQLVAVYDRSNLALLNSEDLATFVGAPFGINTTDPQIQWDPAANRWLYTEIGFATGNNMLVFGWSKTSDPTDLLGGWCHYGVGTGSSLQDYPKLGHDAHFLLVGSNVYDDRSSSFPFVTANIWAITKPAANDSSCSSPVSATYFADATHVLQNSDGTPAFTPIPANAADSVANDTILGAHDASLAPQNEVMQWHMESHPNPVLVADGDITVGTFAIPPSVPQPGTSYQLDSLDGRLTQAVAHFDPSAGAEAVWTQHTIAGSGRSVVRWYEFLPATRAIYQQGVLQSSTDFYFNAAISPASAGNEAAISYNRASSTLLSMIGAQTRTNATPLGKMDAGELSLGSSVAANQEAAFSTNCTQNPCRWGDYSGASPDPVATHAVWGSNQIDGPVFSGYAQWTTQNFAVSTVPPVPDFSLAVSPSSQSAAQGSSTTYTVSIAAVNGFTSAVTLSVSGLPSGAAGTFSPNPASGASSTLTVTTTAGTAAGSYPLTITGSGGGLTRTATATLGVTVPTPDFSLTASPASQTVPVGTGTSYLVSITTVGGFNSAVTMSVTGLPSGATGTFSPNPASGTSSTLAITTSASTPQGSYPLTISGTSGSLTRTTAATLVVNPPPPCSSASVSPASTTQPAGSTVGFSASSTGCPNPQYEYWVGNASGSWSMQRGFSVDPTWQWSTAGLAPGVYTVHVWANQAGDSTATWEAYGSSTVTLSGCTSDTVSGSPASPQPPGTKVGVTASASGCPNPIYEFWLQDPSGAWAMKQAFGAATWSWDTTGYPAGAYTVRVWANQQGADTSTWETYGDLKYTLGGSLPGPCATASLSPASATQPVGSTVSFTASSTGCPSPQYEYWVGNPSGSWSMQRAFSADPTWQWNTAGLAAGVYTIHVWANQTGDSTATWEAYGSSTITLTGAASGPCTSASLAPASATQPAGSTVGFTASSAGCPSPQYEYWVGYPNGSWSMQRTFSADPTWQWSTAGLAPGVYTIHVWANQTGDSTATWEAYGSSTVTLGGCTSASVSPSTGSAATGTTVTFTASSVGCPNPVYEFWLQDTSGAWSMVQGFSTSNVWQWNTTGLAKGNYTVHVWANQQGADLSTWETYGSSTFTLT